MNQYLTIAWDGNGHLDQLDFIKISRVKFRKLDLSVLAARSAIFLCGDDDDDDSGSESKDTTIKVRCTKKIQFLV